MNAPGFLAFRSDLASRAAALSFTSNFLLMVLKITVGIISGSVAVLSDGIDSAEDSVASIFVFISIRVANSPADEEHPYGHGKAESVAAAGQAVLIAGAAAFIVYRAVQRMFDDDVQIDTTPALIALVVTAAVNVAVVLYVSRAAQQTGSVALKADARHLWTNVVQAGAVLLALTLVATTGYAIFDPIMALVLVAYLLWTATQVFMTGLAEIMDMRLPEDEQKIVIACIDEGRGLGVRGYHHLRTRKAGRQRYIDFHLIVDPKETVEEAHEVCTTIEQAIQEKLPGAVVVSHLEPDDGRYRGPEPDAATEGQEQSGG